MNIRPSEYQRERFPTLAECQAIIEKNNVRFRGWAYPHLSSRSGETVYGDSWLASWSSFMGRLEYWRLYQSGQFIHLSSVREFTEKTWDEKLRQRAKDQIVEGSVDWNDVPGFLNITNTLYNVTEIYEFARRLLQSSDFGPTVYISIEIKGIQNFVLMSSENRAWWKRFQTQAATIRHSKTINSIDLMADQRKLVLDAVLGVMERFGWLSPPQHIFEADYDDFVAGRR